MSSWKTNNYQVPENSLLVTTNVKALYISLPNNEGVAAVKGKCDNYTKKTIATKIIITFLALIRETHLSSHWRQIYQLSIFHWYLYHMDQMRQLPQIYKFLLQTFQRANWIFRHFSSLRPQQPFIKITLQKAKCLPKLFACKI